MSMKNELQNQIYGINFDYDEIVLPLDMHGWCSDHPFFEIMINKYKPKIIVEIGVWKGASVIHMANLLKKYSIDGCIIAIDTWLGASDHWTQPEYREALMFKNGFPTIYNQFIANCQLTNVMDIVLPFPLDSLNAMQVFKRLNINIDMIHIDGAHDFLSVASDLDGWYPFVSQGGVVMCDDYYLDGTWPEVRSAVDTFLTKITRLPSFIGEGKCVFLK